MAMAKRSRNFVLVMKCQTTLVGGRRAPAAFQFTPPFGRSMVGWKPAKLALNAGSVSRWGRCQSISIAGEVERPNSAKVEGW